MAPELSAPLARADRRVGRRRRADAGRSRLPTAVEAKLQELLSTRERQDVARVRVELAAYCRRNGLPRPSRATVYNALARVVHAFNYGDTRALSFAAGMPWACLARAADKSGWRPKSLALLGAVMSCRGTPAGPRALRRGPGADHRRHPGDQGARRDFFDLYVMLEQGRLGIVECLRAILLRPERPLAVQLRKVGVRRNATRSGRLGRTKKR